MGQTGKPGDSQETNKAANPIPPIVTILSVMRFVARPRDINVLQLKKYAVTVVSLMTCLALSAQAQPTESPDPDGVSTTSEARGGEENARSWENEYRQQMESVQQRLQEAEATIAALQTQVASTSTPEPAEGDGIVGLLGEHWRNAGDPELDIVSYQTHSASESHGSEKKWYERFTLRGYTQFRINELICQSDDSAPPHYIGDRSIGEDQGFYIRRARLILAGDISDYMYVYLQPDFASTIPGSIDSTYYAQMRDWYADLYLDTEKVYRFRVGQSKVPYGWENLQSSSNRVPLDRSDSMNSALRNERDLGVFFYWTPTPAQDFFKEVLDMGLKGSGNYGVLGVGVYNGQGGSLWEQNDNLHVVTRLTWPIVLASDHHMELGVQAYTGRYTVLSSPISPLGIGPAVRPIGTAETGNRRGILDERIGGTFVWYPEPVGFQAEWNLGHGPALNDTQTEVVGRSLYGGYAMTMVRLEGPRGGIWFPFCRWSYFQGGYKAERNAPYSLIDEWDAGVEWQISKQVEFTSSYLIADRTNTTANSTADTPSYGQFEGQVARFQLQVNY